MHRRPELDRVLERRRVDLILLDLMMAGEDGQCVRAILRRTRDIHRVVSNAPRVVYRFADWRLDVSSRELRDPTQNVVELTTGEFDLLLTVLEHPQRVLNRDQLLDWTRGRGANPFDRTIDVQLSRLRRSSATILARPR